MEMTEQMTPRIKSNEIKNLFSPHDSPATPWWHTSQSRPRHLDRQYLCVVHEHHDDEGQREREHAERGSDQSWVVVSGDQGVLSLYRAFVQTVEMALGALLNLAHPRLRPRVSKVNKQDELRNHEEEGRNERHIAPPCRE